MINIILNITILSFTERLPEKSDMQELIYCMATIKEIQRMSCVTPGSLPHVLTKNMNIKGYDFPEGSVFMANITKFQKDPAVFPVPNKFLSDRFIDTGVDGKPSLKVGVLEIFVLNNLFHFN